MGDVLSLEKLVLNKGTLTLDLLLDTSWNTRIMEEVLKWSLDVDLSIYI